MILEPLNGLLVANPLEGFLGRLEVGVELGDQVAQGMLQHSAGKLTLISSRKSVLRSIVDQTLVSSRKSVPTNGSHKDNFGERLEALSGVESQSWVSF